MTVEQAKELWQAQMLDNAQVREALKGETWHGVAIGFFMGGGFTLNQAIEVCREIDSEEKFYAVLGYAGRVECMEGNQYGAAPPMMHKDSNPDGWIWIQAIKTAEAPNAATAVYKATLEGIPSDAIRRLLQAYLGDKDWTLNSREVDDVDSVDFLLQECGQPSLFAGLERTETESGDIQWEECETAQAVQTAPQTENQAIRTAVDTFFSSF